MNAIEFDRHKHPNEQIDLFHRPIFTPNQLFTTKRYEFEYERIRRRQNQVAKMQEEIAEDIQKIENYKKNNPREVRVRHITRAISRQDSESNAVSSQNLARTSDYAGNDFDTY